MKQIKTLLTVLLLTLSTVFTYSKTYNDTLYIYEIIGDVEFPLDTITVSSVDQPMGCYQYSNSLDTLAYITDGTGYIIGDINEPNLPGTLNNFVSLISIKSKNRIIFKSNINDVDTLQDYIYYLNSGFESHCGLYILYNETQSDTTTINYYTTYGLKTYEKRDNGMVETTSIDETQSTSFNVFPNPTSDYINITGLNTNQTIHILDINGRIVKSTKNTTDTITIDLYDLAPGLYFVNIGNVTHRIIKQ